MLLRWSERRPFHRPPHLDLLGGADPRQPAAELHGRIAGRVYFVGAVVLGFALLYFGVRLAFLDLPLASAPSKMRARHVLQATVIYLPLLFALMMSNSVRP